LAVRQLNQTVSEDQVMHRFCLISIISLLFLTACSDEKKRSDANFAKAINQYLTKHGDVCTVVGRGFPVDVPKSEQGDQYGTGPQLAALEQAGLVHSSDTTAVVHGMLDSLRGSTPPQPVKRYELTEEGKKYFRQASGGLGETGSVCYGQKTVDSIVRWTDPVTTGADSQTEVTYTYRIADLAPWAERPDVQRAFSDVRMTVTGQSRTTQVAGLQLTNKGWQVPES
jgi:hypothetical protein